MSGLGDPGALLEPPYEVPGDVAKERALTVQIVQSGEPILVRGAEVLELQANAAGVAPDRLLELTDLVTREPSLQ